jgi:hypothetical protein
LLNRQTILGSLFRHCLGTEVFGCTQKEYHHTEQTMYNSI